MTRRQMNIIKRMCNGENFWSRSSPRMTKKEADELDLEGFDINSDTPHGFDPGAERRFYPLWIDKFIQKAKDLGIID